MAIWFGHLLTFCQTYWSRARFGVVTTSNGLFRMYPSTGLCVKYDWYESITGLFVWNCAVLTFRLSVNCEVVVGSARIAFVERKPFTTALLPTNFENIVNFFCVCQSSNDRQTQINWTEKKSLHKTSQYCFNKLSGYEFSFCLVSYRSLASHFFREGVSLLVVCYWPCQSFAATYLSNYFFFATGMKKCNRSGPLELYFCC